MFDIRICSDLDHEEIVVDLYFDNSTLAMINQDQGLEKLEVELFPPPNQTSWVLPFNELVEILSKAKKTLHEMQKLPD